ncbi:phospholipid-transporting ATPase ABCA3 [Rhipicephalus microplus]|uniref:phospholipid-transporting ATPase ABCA3 n=1 Tax=Rhipicephalus microplus TaxID=6941 RepID=UPI003F6AB14A
MSLIVALYVVKRRLWLQTVRRHYVAMLLELLCVAAMSKLLLPPSKPDTNGHALSARPEAIVYQALEADKQIMPVLAVVYKPRNPVMDDLIMKSFVEGHSPEVTALMKGPEVESKCRSEWTKYGTHGQVACVEFTEVFGVTGGGSLEYELLQASQFEVPERLPLTGPKSFTLDSDDRFKDYFDFMLAEQAKIDSNFLEKAKGSQDVPKVFLRRLPDAPPFIDQEQFRTGLKYITVMVFSIAFLRRVSAITQELQSGMKDQQRLNGLPSSAFWLGHFLAAFTIQMVDSAIVIAILYIAGSHGYWKDTFFTHTDVSLVIFVMMLFNTGHVLLAMIVSAVCRAGNRATFCAIFVAFFIPSFAFPSEPSSLSGLVFQDRSAKLKSAIAPQYGCSILLRTLAIFDDYEGGAGWGSIFKHALNFDSVTVFELFAVMVLTCIVEVFLLFYLSNVLPWATAYPQSPLFIVMPNYWMPAKVLPEVEGDVQKRDPERFEAPPDLAAAVDIRALTVSFGSFTANDKVSFKIYTTQVTALLGHNGAGKTTLMSAITGLLKPTSGVIEFPGGDGDAHNSTGFCQQFDVLFPDLTVREHLVYFGQLRNVDSEELNKSIDKTLEAVKLTDKACSFPSQLSGGMKRRLSISIALVARPKLLILDEPTTGMDPETRRSIWDLVGELRNNTSILLSTHDMEEADVLADRIVMLSSGKVVCAGSPAFLKQACGVGYTISVNTESGDFDLNETLHIVRKTAPHAVVQNEKQGTTMLALQTTDHKGFAEMFKKLERNSKRLGIASFGVTVATMADVYIKINKLWVPHDGDEEQHGSTRSQGTHQSSLTAHMNIATSANGIQRLRALFRKRALYWTRSPLTIILGSIVPVVLFYLACFGLHLPRSHRTSSAASVGLPQTVELRSSVHFGAARCFVEEAPAVNKFLENFEALAISEGATIDKLEDAKWNLLEFARKDFVKYYTYYAYGITSNATMIEGWYNPASPVSANVLLNLIDTALLRTLSNSPKARITTTAPFYRIKAPGLEEASKDEKPSSSSVALFWVTLPQAVLGLTVSTMAIFPVAEKNSGALELQLMTGVSGPLYVCSHFLFDLLVQYLLPFGASFTMYAFGYETDINLVGFVALYLVLLSFAPVAILWPYLLSGVLQTEGSAFTVTLALFVIGGPVTWVLYMLSLVEVSYPRLVRAAFMLLSPPFALAQAAITAVMEGKIGYFCSIHSDKKSRARVSAPVKQNLRLPARGETFLRVGFDKKINYEEEDPCSVSFFSMSEHSVLPDILLLVVEGLVLFVILSLVHSGYGLSLRKIIDAVHGAPPRGSENALDEDVKTERELVEHLAKTGASPELERLGYTLVAHDLSKWFGSFQAVKGTSVAIRRGECFGLLGVNGAGKSTTFQMLTGLLHLSAGEAYMSDVKLTSSLRKWQSYIGYCPQDNGLLEKLTAFEHLRLFAGLRGVPDSVVETAVHAAVQFVDVEQHADKPCGTYSGGNKRKLSIALAMLGNPRVIFLDEPYAGVDIVSRNKINDRVATMRTGLKVPVVITSHGMEECERACDRLCIMVAGEMTCLGTMQHLRDKFGTGYTMQLVVARREPTGTQVSAAEATTAEVKSNQALDKDVVALFPEVRVLGAHDNVHDYHVKEKLSWSTVFEKVEQLEESHKFSHVLIQDTNLEQIFISFAEKRAEAHEV